MPTKREIQLEREKRLIRLEEKLDLLLKKNKIKYGEDDERKEGKKDKKDA